MSQPKSSDKTTVLDASETSTLQQEIRRAKDQQACLIMIRGTPQGHRFFLQKPTMIVGRDPAADISINDSSISRNHAKIVQNAAGITLFDLGSSNGTFINNKPVKGEQGVLLQKEDMIKLGNSIFKFLPAGEIEILFYGNMQSAAHTDPLTKIYNKGYLLEALEAEFKRAKALNLSFSLIFFDLDHFKKINDTFGHEAGDFVLKEVSHLVKAQQTAGKDIFARYGGEEFVLILSNTPLNEALEKAEDIRSLIAQHSFVYEGKQIPVTTSLGVTDMKPETEQPQSLLKQADKALYAAKTGGRNRVEQA
jgi:two-component system, cell cycle response regulator